MARRAQNTGKRRRPPPPAAAAAARDGVAVERAVLARFDEAPWRSGTSGG